MTKEVQLATTDTFDKLVLKGEGPIVVEFMSYSCEHCRAMEPVLEEVAKMVKSKEKIFQVNIASDRELGSRFSVQATPTLMMFYHGKKVGEVVGPSPTVASVLTALAQPFRSLI